MPTLPKAPAPEQEAAVARVQALLHRLRRGRDNDQLSAYDREELDLIDGEFYWRCCRLDFVAHVAAARKRLGLDPANPGNQHGGPDPFATLNEANDLWVKYRVPDPWAWDHLVRDAPLPLRQPRVRPHADSTDIAATEMLEVKVLSATWTGGQVARYVWRWVDQFNRTHGQTFERPIPVGGSVEIDEAAFPRGFTRSVDAPDVPLGFSVDLDEPAVTMRVWMPLPDERSIAAAYDGRARGENGWHLRLPSQDGTTPAVALRTWALARLLKATVPYREAEEIAYVEGGLPYIERTGYYADLARLRERVPDATPWLPETKAALEAKRRAKAPLAPLAR